MLALPDRYFDIFRHSIDKLNLLSETPESLLFRALASYFE